MTRRALIALALTACGGQASMPGTGGHATTTTTTLLMGGAGGAPAEATECVSEADCAGRPCVPLTPDGYSVCLAPVAPVTSCGPGQMGCCDSAACAPGSLCYPPFGYCGGIVGPQNKCLADQCQSDSDCAPGGVCVSAGTFAYPVKACMAARCARNADCGAEPDGVCAPVEDNCCGGIFALLCVYPSGCRRNADCPASRPVCAADAATGAARCLTPAEAPACPI